MTARSFERQSGTRRTLEAHLEQRTSVMRRIILEEPWSRAAIWSRSFAVFALAVAIIGVIMARMGLDPTAAIAVEGSAMVIAGLAILSALVGMVVIWRTGYRGTGRILAGLFIAALILAYPGFILAQSRTIPPLDDISTDLADPPSFSKTEQALTARNGAMPGDALPEVRAMQQRLYPDLQPVVLDMEAMDAHRLVLKLVAARRWRLVEDILPLGKTSVGRVDAVAKSTIMGFPADVTIRIKPLGSQSRIDIRSVSRTKWNGPGSNAGRVQTFAADLEDQADEK